MLSEKEFLLFVHIPKCGGTSVHHALRRLLKGRYLHLPPLKSNWPQSIDFSKLLGGGGHQPVGMSPLEKVDRPIRYISITRNPLDRYISYYRHVQTDENHYLRDREGFVGVDITTFARNLIDLGVMESANTQCAYLAGRTGAGFDEAQEIINQNNINVIPSPSLDDFFQKLYKSQGREYETDRRNVSTYELSLDQAARRKLSAQIREANEDDYKLYKWTESRYMTTKGMDVQLQD